MKKILAFALVLMMAFGCVMAIAEPTMMTGAWQVAEDTEITDEQRTVFDKALEGLVGVNYEPLAYLGSQVVAGTNHCFLCRATVVYPGAVPSLALIYIYQDLEGNCTINNIAMLDIAELSNAAME